MIEFIKNNKINILFIVVYLVITIVSLCFHEIWQDEGQAWCIARDLNLIDIYKTTRIEGHPLLWYLVLMPFAKTGLPVFSMQIISLFFMLSAVLIILFKFKLNNLEKFLIIFSAGMLYYLPTVSRSYALIPVILSLIAVIWNKRSKYAGVFVCLIVLLLNTHLYMLGLSFALFSLFFYESLLQYKKDKEINGLKWCLLPVCIFIFLILTFYGVNNQNYLYLLNKQNHIDIQTFIQLISRVFVYPVFKNFPFLIRFSDIFAVLSTIFSLIAAFIGLYRTDKKILYIFTLSICYMLTVFYSCWVGGVLYQKVYMMVLVGIFCFLILKKSENKISKWFYFAFYIIGIIGVIVSPFVIIPDIKYNFSGAKEISTYIRKNLNNQKEFIVLGNPYLYASISAYLPDKKLYDIRTQSYISYYTYNINEIPKKEPFPDTKYSIADNEVIINDGKEFNVLYKTAKENLSVKSPQEIFRLCIINVK